MFEAIFEIMEKILVQAGVSDTAMAIISDVFEMILGFFA